jgi:membrane protease YdiL (CAAX protease family)
MNAPGVWAGMADSVFLAGVNDRERDPARVATAVTGGLAVGCVASACLMVLLLTAYAILIGDGRLGLAGLGAVAGDLTDPRAFSPGITLFRLIFTTGVNGVFWLAFVAFAALALAQPLLVFVTAASHVRWRLLAVGVALSAMVLGPVVIGDRLLTAGGSAPPFLAISPQAIDRVVFALSTLLLIPAAAAEELFFRGWLLRQTGVFLRRPLTLLAVSAIGFSALHFDFSPDAFLSRALMGAGFAYMTLRLGGIEFSTGVHAVNNIMVVLFLQPLTLGQAADTAGGADVSALSLIEDVALVGGYILITELVARSPALRRLAGVKTEEVSRSADVSAHFG